MAPNVRVCAVEDMIGLLRIHWLDHVGRNAGLCRADRQREERSTEYDSAETCAPP